MEGDSISVDIGDGRASLSMADSTFGGDGNISGYLIFAMLDPGRFNSTLISLREVSKC